MQPLPSYFDPISFSKSDPDLDLGLEKLYKLESIGLNETSMGTLDEIKVDKFKKSILLQNNRYYVELPWHEELIPKVLPNHHIALTTLKRVHNFLMNKNLLSNYNDVFQQQLKDGIIEKIAVKPEEYSNSIWIPHRPILKVENQVTTKIRPVFNCSLKIGQTPSLNEASYPGIDLMKSLFSLLCQFRTNKFVILSDVKQAFLQIQLKLEEDRNRFCFFWIENDQLVTYRYKTIVFGLASSPFILNYVIKFHANRYPADLTSQVLKNNFYVDNLIYTNSDTDTLIHLYYESNQRMLEGGFNLRSWNTNNEKLNAIIGKEGKGVEHRESSERVLGYLYEIETDTMKLADFQLDQESKTKRQILSQTSKVFDPLSLYLPVTIRGRLLVRKLWDLKLAWDENIGLCEQKEWSKISKDLSLLKEIKFGRSTFSTDSSSTVKLGIFCDASASCYGFSVYAISEGSTNLIYSKAKVAPLEKRTLPCLELLSLYLAMKCLPQFLESFNISFNTIHIFLDAQIVLSWVLSPDANVKIKQIFVRNRIQDIRQWHKEIEVKFNTSILFHYVPTDENPADLLTRGISFKEFNKNLEFWSQGPAWLKESDKTWPKYELQCLSSPSKLCTPSAIVTSVTLNEDSTEPIMDITKYSDINKLFRITSLVLKFIFKLRKKTDVDLDRATKLYWLYIMQLESFGTENTFLENAEKEPNKNAPVPDLVNRLNLFLDDVRLIRTKGRISKCNFYDYGVVNPILLGKNHYLTSLFIIDFHRRCKHLGIQSTLNFLRTQGYWVTCARQTVKRVLSDCIICKKYNNFAFRYPKLTNYPKHSMNLFTPFKDVGIDFTGHLFVRDPDSNKTVKRFIIIYTCLHVRAIYLDLLPDMSTESFLLSFQRFSNLYGVCDRVYTDNAKSFLLGGKILQKSLKSNEFIEHMRSNDIKHFTLPVYSAWMGSAWERLIRIVKSCLYKTIGRAILDHFQLLTLLSSIQDSVNSRPLTYISSDNTDYGEVSPLTPNSFLKPNCNSALVFRTDDADDPLWTKDPPLHKELNQSVQKLQKKYEHFREIWYESYLLSLREHSRNLFETDWTNRMKVGDVVLIKSSNKPRVYWSMGRILHLFVGEDHKVRVVKLKRGDGAILEYPICHLYPLELSITHNGSRRGNSEEVESSRLPKRKAAVQCRDKVRACLD